MTDRDTTTRTRARAPGVGGVFHRMAVHDRVLRPDSERTTVATTKCTKGGCKLDGGRRMPGAGLSRRSPRKAPLGQSAFQPYWGKLAVRNDRGDRGNVGIIRSPIRASILPDHNRHRRPPNICAKASLTWIKCVQPFLTSKCWSDEWSTKAMAINAHVAELEGDIISWRGRLPTR